MPTIPELSDRARDVFRLVVEAYVEAGTPVGSMTIARTSGLNLSPASIRTVMQDLEEAGLLAAPHTSAGRIPTETGLRLFVDGIMQAAEPSREERAAIEARIERAGPIEEAIGAATAALSGLSACAGIVLVPKEEPILRQLAFGTSTMPAQAERPESAAVAAPIASSIGPARSIRASIAARSSRDGSAACMMPSTNRRSPVSVGIRPADVCG